MDSKNVLLSVALFTAVGLVGCQAVKNDQKLSTSDVSHQINQVSWGKSGELFRKPNDENLKANESRIVFFRDTDASQQPKNINIGIGLDNVFQSSLQNGHYSEQIVCRGSHVINASFLNEKDSNIVSYAENYQFVPQTTTYLKVDLSKTGSPNVQQISANEALPLLQQSTRQTHQISRVPSDCNAVNQTQQSQTLPNQNLPSRDLSQQPSRESVADTPIDAQNLKQFKVLFDFDSAAIKNNNSAVLDGMANFIQSYPKTDIVLEGHTDNRGAESYNLKLSQSRADRVKNILVDKYGMESSRLRAVGYGETMPIDTNATEQGRQNNRRVVATISQ